MTEKTKILVADDEKIWRDQIKEILANDEYDITIADSGDNAIELVENSEFDVIILDMRMESEFRGIEVLEYVNKKSPFTPVILLTAFGTIDTATESMKKGAFDFIEKGGKYSSNKEIRKKVKEALHYLFYEPLKKEIITILKSELEIRKYDLLKKIKARGISKTEKFNVVLEDMEKNNEITHDNFLIKYMGKSK